MHDTPRIGRRAACLSLFGLGGGLLAAGHALGQEKSDKPKTKGTKKPRTPPVFNNADFYGPDGKFNEEAAKKAYLTLCRYFGYPMNETIRKNVFVADFGLGHFTEVGLGGVLWLSDKEASYASIEVFLLPNQMIPEHWHVPIEGEGVKPKMESWIVRYGSTFTYGEGEAAAKPAVTIHEIQAKHVTVMHEKAVRPGEVAGVGKVGEKHWQQAGPEGCILTEVSTYHTGAAVRFSDPKIKF